jgi:hypothetical protein
VRIDKVDYKEEKMEIMNKEETEKITKMSFSDLANLAGDQNFLAQVVSAVYNYGIQLGKQQALRTKEVSKNTSEVR